MPYPATPEQIVRTLYTYLEGRRLDGLLKILEAAKPSLVEGDYDNLDGGTAPYFLFLEISASIFAGIENIDEVEELFTEHLRKLFRHDRGDVLSRVRFRPSLEEGAPIPATPVLKDDAYRIWQDGFRLFISHSSVQKEIASNLREELAEYGITAFVAHTDIEPNLHWQAEIEIALRSMDAMAAIITPEFHNSVWTNQEVGFALGKEVPISRILIGAAPKGFLGTVQGIPYINAKLAIVEQLLKSSKTHLKMRKSICRSLNYAGSFKKAEELLALLPDEVYSDEEKELLKISLSNNQVSNPWVDSSKIINIIK